MATRYVERKAKRTGGVRNPETPASRKTNRPSSVQIQPGDMGSSYTKANELRRNRGGNILNNTASTMMNPVRSAVRQGLTRQQAQDNVSKNAGKALMDSVRKAEREQNRVNRSDLQYLEQKNNNLSKERIRGAIANQANRAVKQRLKNKMKDRIAR